MKPPIVGIPTIAAFNKGRGARCVHFAPTKAPIVSPKSVCTKMSRSSRPFIMYPSPPAAEIGRMTIMHVPIDCRSGTPKTQSSVSWMKAAAPMPNAPDRKPLTKPSESP